MSTESHSPDSIKHKSWVVSWLEHKRQFYNNLKSGAISNNAEAEWLAIFARIMNETRVNTVNDTRLLHVVSGTTRNEPTPTRIGHAAFTGPTLWRQHRIVTIAL